MHAAATHNGTIARDRSCRHPPAEALALMLVYGVEALIATREGLRVGESG